MKRKLQVYRGDGVIVTFDPTLCVHAAECIRRLPAVFDTSRPDWIRPKAAPAEEVSEVVSHCPTGALQAVRLGVAPARGESASGRVRVELLDTGSVVIRGPIELVRESGQPELRDGTLSICRCGRSANHPFCDGSHAG